MTWEESDRLTWDEREALLEMTDMRTRERQATATPAGHVPAAERMARRAG